MECLKSSGLNRMIKVYDTHVINEPEMDNNP